MDTFDVVRGRALFEVRLEIGLRRRERAERERMQATIATCFGGARELDQRVAREQRARVIVEARVSVAEVREDADGERRASDGEQVLGLEAAGMAEIASREVREVGVSDHATAVVRVLEHAARAAVSHEEVPGEADGLDLEARAPRDRDVDEGEGEREAATRAKHVREVAVLRGVVVASLAVEAVARMKMCTQPACDRFGRAFELQPVRQLVERRERGLRVESFVEARGECEREALEGHAHVGDEGDERSHRVRTVRRARGGVKAARFGPETATEALDGAQDRREETGSEGRRPESEGRRASAHRRPESELAQGRNPGSAPRVEVTMVRFLLWLVVLFFCWPLALLALFLWPVIWILSLPFRLLGVAVDGVFDLLRAVFSLPARLLGGGRRVRRA